MIRAPEPDAARQVVLSRFRWSGGHADIWRVVEDGPALAAVVDGLAQPWVDRGVTRVLGIESRGFLLGGAVAVRLRAGFQAVRKTDGLLPGPKLRAQTQPDYRARRHVLRTQATLTPDDVVLLVDDWAERGSQAMAARALVEDAGATFAGISLVVDQLNDEVRAVLGRVTALVRADELGDPDAAP